VPQQQWSIELKFKSPTKDNVIKSWFVVEQSNLENASLGVFTDQKFQKQEAMGLYMGQNRS
jgi:hypothetical protein